MGAKKIQSWKKKRRLETESEVGDQVFVRVKAKRSTFST
jgi:hypothetical protein